MATQGLVQKLRKQLHQSGVETLGKCGVMWEFRYVKGLKRRPNSYLMCGNATDVGVNTDLTHKINTGEQEQEKVCTDAARDYVENYPEKDNLELDEDEKVKSVQQIVDAAKDKATRFVSTHHREIAPPLHPTHVQRAFSLNMDKWLRGKAKEIHTRAEQAENVWLKKVLHQQAAHLNAAARDGFDLVGTQDVVEDYIDTGHGRGDYKMLVIRDTKTSKKSPNEETAHQSHQLSAYALASQITDGRLPDRLVLDYLIDLKSGTKVMQLETHRDAEQAAAYLSRVVNAIVSIRSGVFMPAPNTAWWCSAKYCGYHSICPHVKHQVTTVGQTPLVQIQPGDTQNE